MLLCTVFGYIWVDTMTTQNVFTVQVDKCTYIHTYILAGINAIKEHSLHVPGRGRHLCVGEYLERLCP